ncbi:FAD-binding oxidoreductase [Methylopila sp. M107]|uniref:NAD(P)/FAD-dependent oxidoreductase n=1 Tax=Methylopila sp. M107 TaxID=1101190 RepID=UPI0003A1849D|nr:FAD-binding oxidoreductase [Methylopila sp. M107]
MAARQSAPALTAMLGASGRTDGSSPGAGRGWRVSTYKSRAETVRTISELPADADVVVIGAGIAGVSAALFLNEKGLRTVVLEKGFVAGEQSSRAFGWIYTNGWDTGKLELANRSKAIWDSFASRFGEDIGFRRSGNFMLLATDDEVDVQKAWLKSALEAQPQMDARFISGSELDGHIPGASEKFKAALHQASDGTAEPTYSVSAIARGAIREGVRIVSPCAARTIDREVGKVCGVRTELGYIKTRHVVIAGGAWSSLFAGNLGVHLPQLAINSSMQWLSRIDDALPGAGNGPDFTWRRMDNGETAVGVARNVFPITKDSFRFFRDFVPALKHSRDLLKIRLSRDLIASLRVKSRWTGEERTPFEDVRVLAGRLDVHETNRALANLRRAYPQYEGAEVKERWGSMIDATPDSTQFVCDVPSVPGLFVITGFSGNGLTSAPGSGEMISEMVAGEKTTCDPSIYRFGRFTDGSKFVFRH